MQHRDGERLWPSACRRASFRYEAGELGEELYGRRRHQSGSRRLQRYVRGRDEHAALHRVCEEEARAAPPSGCRRGARQPAGAPRSRGTNAPRSGRLPTHSPTAVLPGAEPHRTLLVLREEQPQTNRQTDRRNPASRNPVRATTRANGSARRLVSPLRTPSAHVIFAARQAFSPTSPEP